MTLTELLNMQRELQTHSDTQPETLFQIRLAQMAELGEIIQAVKWGMEPVTKYPAWAWWHRASKPVATRTDVADELADLLCFVLLEFIHQDINSVKSDPWQRTWETPLAKVDYIAKLNLEAVFVVTSLGEKITHFVGICRALGFTQDEIEAAYRDAYDKNVKRWTAA